MRMKKKMAMAVVMSLAGLVAIALSGCEWFSFNRSKTEVSDSLGYENGTGSWLTSAMDSNRFDAYEAYRNLIAMGELDPGVTFMQYLNMIGDSSSALTSGLRSSVALAVAFNSASASAGSGVVYSMEANAEGGATAYVVTNYHVVYNRQESGSDKFGKHIYAYLYGDKYDTENLASTDALSATYVGGSMEQDIAVLAMEIPEERVDYVQTIGADVGKRNSDHLNAGEKVYAVGNLLGGGISVVSGVVSVEAEYNEFAKLDSPTQAVEMLTVRIDAPVNHGNSGGGLFDGNGNFIGLVNGGREVTVKTDEGNDSVAVNGYGFAIPANRVFSVVQSVLDNLDKGEKAAYYGLLGEFETASSRGEFNSNTQTIDIVEEVVIQSVTSGSPFGRDIAGKTLKKITVVNKAQKTTVDQTIVRKHQAETILFNLRSGDTVTLTFADGTTAEGVYGNHFRKTA